MLAQILNHGIDDYHPPFASGDIPHPRTIPDIILRSLFIQLCAALAYALLQITPGWSSGQRGSRSSWLLWSLCSTLLPELVLMQIGLRLVGRLVSWTTELSYANSAMQSHRRPTAGGMKALSIRLALFQIVVLGAPLYFAFRGYQQRLGMSWHGATYVANLGLDHRNGWSTLSGLTSCASVLLLSIHNAVFRGSRHGNELNTVLRPSDPDKDTDEESFGNDIEKDSPSGSSSAYISTSNYTKLLGGLDVSPPLLFATLVHQILLAVTNRPPPLLAFFITRWSFSIVPVLCISFLLLPTARRQTLQRAYAPEKSGDWSLSFALFLQNTVMIASWLLIASTIIVQAWSDVDELRSVGAGHMQPWNYRWRVKDRFSHGANGIYMEG